MFSFPFSTAMTANQTGLNPLSGTQYEFIPEGIPHKISLFLRATTVAVRATIYSGSETIQERAPVQGGGTAGVTPSSFTTDPVEWIAAGGDRVKVALDETAAGTPTVDGLYKGVELV